MGRSKDGLKPEMPFSLALTKKKKKKKKKKKEGGIKQATEDFETGWERGEESCD